jgi:hypothetical protein
MTKIANRHFELLSPTSTNFMGTGLTFKEYIELDIANKVETSWFWQDRQERKRRLNFITELTIELEKIKVTTLFATSLAELGIESIIEGEWKMVKEWAEHFTFVDDPTTKAHYPNLFARFSELLQQAYETRPGEMTVKA